MHTKTALMAEAAEFHIDSSIAFASHSAAPCTKRAAGEIDMAYKLKLIDYPRRNALIGQLQQAVSERRTALRAVEHARSVGDA